ncbi:hypothetical protein BH20BAC1_BH20BAC1_01500 [soil metagenome]
MQNLFLSLFAFSLLFTLNSCHTIKPISEGSTGANEMLYNYKWYLTDLEGKPYTFAGRDNDYTYLLFNAGSPAKVSGFTGCNRLTGSVEFKGVNFLKFSPLATTKMACPGNTESTLLNVLTSVNNYSITNNQLLLNNGKILVAKLNGVSMETSKLN